MEGGKVPKWGEDLFFFFFFFCFSLFKTTKICFGSTKLEIFYCSTGKKAFHTRKNDFALSEKFSCYVHAHKCSSDTCSSEAIRVQNLDSGVFYHFRIKLTKTLSPTSATQISNPQLSIPIYSFKPQSQDTNLIMTNYSNLNWLIDWLM